MICTGVNQGNEKDFDNVFNFVNKTDDVSLRNDLLAALACSKNPLLQNRLLDDQLKYSNDILIALINVVNRPNGFVTSWNFLKANWKQIYSKYIYLDFDLEFLKFFFN